MAKTFDKNDDSVVVVIGSGAGGGVLGNELAQKGVNVVCLEAGPRFTLDDIENDWNTMFGRLSWLDSRKGTGDLNAGLPLWVCKTVGGTTVHWAGASLRFLEHEFKAKSAYGNIEGANLLDWPIDLHEMERFYSMAEDKMGTTGTHGIPRLPGNNNFQVMEYGAKALGYQDVHTGNMSINSQPRDGRPGCHQIGFCMAGCAIGAKWSTLYTEIPRAEATGHYELRPESMVLKINHNKEGKASGVVYVDADGNTHEQKARVVAIAGNSVETPRLLLNSESSMFSDGMANSSGQVGQNFMRHMTGTVYGTMPGAVHWDRGTQMAGIVMDEVKNDPNRGFVGGYYMQTLPGFGLGWYAGNVGGMSADAPGKWGRNYTRDVVENYKNMAGMWLVGEDMPQEKNGVTLHGSEKDSYGLPVPVVNFEDHANDVAMRNHAYKAGSAVYQAGGSKKQYQLSPFPSTHNMGTCRMSAKPRDGVCNSTGATHDVSNVFISDGSQFTTGAACNPTLTIVSLAIRQAENMTKMLSQNTI